MQIQYTLILVAALAQFILGAVWYSPLMFGNWWMKIMEVTHLSQEALKKTQQQMLPFYGLQFVLTVMFTFVLMMFLSSLPEYWNNYGIAGFIWLGFIVPTQVAGVIWGSTKKNFWGLQIFIMTSYQFVGLMIATYILPM